MVRRNQKAHLLPAERCGHYSGAMIVTLTTDFGERDPYVAAMKGVITSRCLEARVIDLTHQIGAQDLVETALFVSATVPTFPASTIHVIVVDPGVGTQRRPLVVTWSDQILV